MNLKKCLFISVLVMLLFSALLAACQPAPAEPEEEAAPTAEAAPTEEPAAEEPAPSGGTLTMFDTYDYPTLDIQKLSGTGLFHELYGASLLTMHPETGEYVPYLAESYTVSEDGLTYIFSLKKNIKFSNGDPLTTKDFIYTIQRAQDPEIASPMSGTIYGPVAEYEAVDDYTLRLTLGEPNFPWIIGIVTSASQPVSQRAIEEMGADYDFHPVSVGPFLVEEFVTGEKAVLVRNPDYDWAPEFLEPGPAKIDSIVFRIIPEYATRIAGLESGDLDFSDLSYPDYPRFEADDQFDIMTYYPQGMWPFIAFNLSKPPFDNLLVRQAFCYAVDHDALVSIMLQGHGEPLYGPITKGTIGYDPFVEEIGYHLDLEKAKALMQEAGFTYDADGMLLTPDGQPFVLDMPVENGGERPKMAEVLSEQFKRLGVQINIVVEDPGINWERLIGGDYQIAISGLGWPDAEMMYIALHSSFIGMVNLSQANDPLLDELLTKTRTEVEPASRQEAVNAAVQYIIGNALLSPVYSAETYYAMNSRVKGYVFSAPNATLWLNNAYIEE
jgi:peptide/nickel transport system substrate-binding protein